MDGLKRLDDNYFESLEEKNGDFDLKNLNENGDPNQVQTTSKRTNKIEYLSNQQKQQQNKLDKRTIHEVPRSVRLLGVYFDPNYI